MKYDATASTAPLTNHCRVTRDEYVTGMGDAIVIGAGHSRSTRSTTKSHIKTHQARDLISFTEWQQAELRSWCDLLR